MLSRQVLVIRDERAVPDLMSDLPHIDRTHVDSHPTNKNTEDTPHRSYYEPLF